MPTPQNQFNVTPGMIVKTADGAILGRVATSENDTFCIAKGLFFPEDFCAKTTEIKNVSNGEIELLQTREEFLCHDYEEGLHSFEDIAA
ncbi:MAG: hypothetical protein H7222_05400 [Methylotenera sp.]|nr:hypothetical protein [Oligoflexia bacterium]